MFGRAMSPIAGLRPKIQGILFILFFLVSPTIAFSEESATSLEQRAGQFIAASSNNFPPVNYLDENGNLEGFAQALSKAVIQSIGGELTHIHSPRWPEVVGYLTDGHADFLQDVGFTVDRTSFLDFTIPILEMPERIFVRAGAPTFTNRASLNNHSVACINKHITHMYLQKFPEIHCRVYPTPLAGLQGLVNGEVDAFVYPEQIVAHLAKENGLFAKINTTGEPLRVLNWSMGVRKGEIELLLALNRGILAVKKSGEYNRIYNRYFTPLSVGEIGPSSTWITLAAIGLVLIFGTGAGVLALFLVRLRSANITSEKTIQAQQQAEANLRESEARFRVIVESSLQGIAIHWNHKLLFVNQALVDMYGFESADKMLALDSTLELMDPEDRPWLIERNEQRLKGFEIPSDSEFRGRRKDGQQIWVANRSRTIGWEGKPAVLSMREDITARKQREQGLRDTVGQMQTDSMQLVQAGKMAIVGELAAGIAHEINNPLATISSSTEILQELLLTQRKTNPELAEKCGKHLDKIYNNVYRSKNIIRSILEFSRDDTGILATVNVFDLILETHALLETDKDARKRKFEIIINSPGQPTRTLTPEAARDMPPEIKSQYRIRSAANQLRQIFLNLFINAIHATKASGRIKIELERKPVEIIVKIEDDGHGISEENLSRIFEPFYTTKAASRGTGLGLSLSKQIALALGGEIEVSSQLGNGTVMTVRLPSSEPYLLRADPTKTA